MSLTPISDSALVALSATSPIMAAGALDPVTEAMMATNLPDIASEMLAHRRAASQATRIAVEAEIARATRIQSARDVIFAPRPTPAKTMQQACETLLQLSTDPQDITAASAILRAQKAAR